MKVSKALNIAFYICAFVATFKFLTFSLFSGVIWSAISYGVYYLSQESKKYETSSGRFMFSHLINRLNKKLQSFSKPKQTSRENLTPEQKKAKYSSDNYDFSFQEDHNKNRYKD